MLNVGQKAKTKLGFLVEIVAILDRPDSHGFCIVGVRTLDDEREIWMWKANGGFMMSGVPSCNDLVMEPVIETRYVYPPIPDRSCDWCAWYADRDEEGPVGWGATKDEAIADLKDNHPREEAEAA